MPTTMIAQRPTAVQAPNYVAPYGDSEREGARMYNAGKRLDECQTDAQTRGWLAAEARGADAYYRCMMADASDIEM
jgi:hypothetical protein